jgi:regulator of protease activity HflC (stomatin/prohibitin superfamily)
MTVFVVVIAILLVLAVLFLLVSVKVVTEYERAIVFRMGRVRPVKGPGLIIVFPIVDRIVRVGLRTVTLEIPPQELVSRDNVTVRVIGVAYFKVIDADRAVLSVQNYQYATSQAAQTTLLSSLRQHNLDELLREREQISDILRIRIDAITEPWGIEVTSVEVKDVELPEQMRRAMAREAESERERRAKVIHAQGEFEAAATLRRAAEELAASPGAMQLRQLSTLTEIAVEKNSTIIFPLPVELIQLVGGMGGAKVAAAGDSTNGGRPAEPPIPPPPSIATTTE